MVKPSVKTLLFHWYILGIIKAPNEFTAVSSWLGVETAMGRTGDSLIEGLAEEIVLASKVTTKTDIFLLWEVASRIEQVLTRREQEELLSYLKERILLTIERELQHE